VKDKIKEGHTITGTTLEIAKSQVGTLLRIILSRKYHENCEPVLRKWATTFVGVLIPELSAHFVEEEEAVFFAIERIIKAVCVRKKKSCEADKKKKKKAS
jgi:hypothetical protein